VLSIEKTGHIYYAHSNSLGSITALTDESGNVVERIRYDIFGKASIQDADGNDIIDPSTSKPRSFSNITPYLFQGREYDPESGLYNFRNRYYSPDMGRFISFDPLGYVDGMNLYEFVNGNPVNYVDPMGLMNAKIFKKEIQESGTKIEKQYSSYIPNENKKAVEYSTNAKVYVKSEFNDKLAKSGLVKIPEGIMAKGYIDPKTGNIVLNDTQGDKDAARHETTHKYANQNWKNNLGGYVTDSDIALNEGITEYYTKQANQDYSGSSLYEGNTNLVKDMVKEIGEETVSKAFYGGEQNSINKVKEWWKKHFKTGKEFVNGENLLWECL
jgi:RHS repeat-associated protein